MATYVEPSISPFTDAEMQAVLNLPEEYRKYVDPSSPYFSQTAYNVWQRNIAQGGVQTGGYVYYTPGVDDAAAMALATSKAIEYGVIEAPTVIPPTTTTPTYTPTATTPTYMPSTGGAGSWSDVVGLGVVALVGLVGLSFLLGKK